MNASKVVTRCVLVMSTLLAFPAITQADAAYDTLKKQIELMQKQINELQKAL